jgi:ABC-type uncharacterized transport system involved in gliding motility auxiliary subunit
MLLLVGLSFGLTGLVCYISTRRFTRIDMTGQREHALHSKTKRMLRSLEQPLNITILYDSSNPDVRYVWYDRVSSMLQEFKAINSNVQIKEYETFNQWEEVQKEVLPSIETSDIPPSCAIFRIGDSSEIVPYEKTLKAGDRRGGKPKFLAESAFASALAKLTAQEQSLVCVLTGHGERPLEGQGRQQSMTGMSREQQVLGSERFSLSVLADRLEQDNFKVQSLNLAAGDSIPENCNAIIIPGPRTPPISEEEAQKISAYLEQDNGRLLAMIDSDAVTSSGTNPGALESVLSNYGIQARDDAVGMQEMRGLAFAEGGLVERTRAEQSVNVSSEGYAQHPVTSDLTNYTIGFSQPCPIEIENQRPAPMMQARPLLTGVSGSWGETNLQGNLGEASFDGSSDIQGPVVLAAVAQPAAPPQRNPRAPRPDPSDLEGPRIIVVGSSFSFTNAAVEQNPANLYFMQNAVNWLAGKTHMLGIPAKDININMANLTDAQMHASRWIFIGILPGIIVIIGITVWQIRRR